MGNKKATYISIISGKGGTGKTLLTAVLGRALAQTGLNVLLIDLDIFVRGLSILLSTYQKKSFSLNKLSVSDLLLQQQQKINHNPQDNSFKYPQKTNVSDLAISRFFECDILPATNDIGDPLDYDDSVFSSKRTLVSFIDEIFSITSSNYDIVLIDCRSGIDSLVISISSKSDLAMSVAEDDDVCLQANTNLINHLRYKKDIKKVFTIINKGRRITNYDELKERSFQRTDFNYIGVIPFDIEVMQDFGKPRFWNSVQETLYFYAVIKSWNYLAERNNLDPIPKENYHFPPTIFMSPKQGRMPLINRMLRLYGIGFLGTALFMTVYRFFKFNPSALSTVDLTIFVSFLAGSISLLFSGSNIRKWILGETDKPEKK